MAKIKANVEKSGKAIDLPKPAHFMPFESLHREMDRFFDQFSETRPWLRRFWEPKHWDFDLPAADLSEDDDAFEISMELPGLDAKDVDITASDGLLTVKGEKSAEKEEKKKRYYLSERHYGSFERSIALPQGIDMDKITADYKSGVLNIRLPKTAEAKSHQRKITVKGK